MPSDFAGSPGLCLFSGDGSFCGFTDCCSNCALYLAAVLLASISFIFREWITGSPALSKASVSSLLFCNNKISSSILRISACLGQLTLILRFHSLFGLVNMPVLLLQGFPDRFFALQVSAGALCSFFHLNTEIVRMTHAARNPN